MRKIAEKRTQHVTLRIPENWVEEFKAIADAKNPWRAIMRDALKQYLRKLGKLPDAI